MVPVKDEFAKTRTKAAPAILHLIARAKPRGWNGDVSVTGEETNRDTPQISHRSAQQILGFLLLGALQACLIGASISYVASRFRAEPGPPASSTLHAPTAAELMASARELSWTDVIDWQRSYADLIGSSEALATERLGSPDSRSVSFAAWEPSVKTLGRAVFASLRNGKVVSVLIKPKTTEFMDFSTVSEHGGFSLAVKKLDPDGRFGYWLTLRSRDGHCEIRFTLDDGLDLESIKFQ